MNKFTTNNVPVVSNISYDDIKLNDIFKGDEVSSKTKFFSTNVFIPQDIQSVNEKTYLYLTGFIKLVETFSKRTDGEWGLKIYVDNMFVDDKTYDGVSYELNNSNSEYNKSIKYRFSNANQVPQQACKLYDDSSDSEEEDDDTPCISGKRGEDFKKELNVILKLYKKYIEHIKTNSATYKLIHIISFKCMSLNRTDKYLGHPSTFGSLIRFIPIFDKSYDAVVCINISHAISIPFFDQILEWIESDKPLMTISRGYDFTSNINNMTVSNALIIQMFFSKKFNINRNIDKVRLPAGLFGIRPKDLKNECDEFKKLMVLLIEIFNMYADGDKTSFNPYKYSIDEIIITTVLLDLFKKGDVYRKHYNDNIYLLGYSYKDLIDLTISADIARKLESKVNDISYNHSLSGSYSLSKIPYEYIKNVSIEHSSSSEKTEFYFDINQHRYLSFNLFKTTEPGGLIDPLKYYSKLTNPFVMFLDSFDECKPLIVKNKAKASTIEQNYYTIFNASEIEENLNNIIEYYATLKPLNITIHNDVTIDTTQWKSTYHRNIFLSNENDPQIVDLTKTYHELKKSQLAGGYYIKVNKYSKINKRLTKNSKKQHKYTKHNTKRRTHTKKNKSRRLYKRNK